MRRSGKTFRLILKALHEMSMGKEVVVNCYRLETAHRVFNQLLHMIETYISTRELSIDSSSRTLKITGCKGSLRCVSDTEAQVYVEHRNSASYVYYTDAQ